MGIGKMVLDGLTNVLTGLGRTVRGDNHWQLTIRGQAENETAYRSSWLCRKIHDIPPYDMTRAGRNWQTDKDTIQAIEAEERRLGVLAKARRAMSLARLHGGAALILGLPGNPSTEIKPEQVGKDGIAYIHVVSRWQLNISELERDVRSPFFGQPKLYTMTSAGSDNVEIHPSRVIPFVSQPLPEGALRATAEDFWGDPLMMTLAETLDSCEITQAAVSGLMTEAKLDVITIPGLMDMVGNAEYEARLLRRLTIAQGLKSTSNALLVSGPDREGGVGEKWEHRQVNFSGLPDVLKVFLQVASGAADIPATRLIGQSPAGMDATGESDLRNYYDMIASRQATDLTPALDPLDDFLLRSALGSRPDDIFYIWAPLWQMTPEQKAEVFDKTSKSIKTISDTGLVPTRALEEAVQNRLIEDGGLPGLEKALEGMSEEERFPSLTAPTPEELAAAMAGDPPAPGAGQGQPPRRRAANDGLADASPRTLYVSRKVMNAAAILAHFKGLPNREDAADLHTTIAYSRTPVDWMTIAADWTREENGGLKLPPGGPRVVEHLGDGGAIVLFFNSWELSHRHGEIRQAGASWDYDKYEPHIALAYDAEHAVDLSGVEPWTGEIILGPEIFEEVDTGEAEAEAAE